MVIIITKSGVNLVGKSVLIWCTANHNYPRSTFQPMFSSVIILFERSYVDLIGSMRVCFAPSCSLISDARCTACRSCESCFLPAISPEINNRYRHPWTNERIAPVWNRTARIWRRTGEAWNYEKNSGCIMVACPGGGWNADDVTWVSSSDYRAFLLHSVTVSSVRAAWYMYIMPGGIRKRLPCHIHGRPFRTQILPLSSCSF